MITTSFLKLIFWSQIKFEEEFFKLKIEIQSKTQRSLLMGSVKLTLNQIIPISF